MRPSLAQVGTLSFLPPLVWCVRFIYLFIPTTPPRTSAQRGPRRDRGMLNPFHATRSPIPSAADHRDFKGDRAACFFFSPCPVRSTPLAILSGHPLWPPPLAIPSPPSLQRTRDAREPRGLSTAVVYSWFTRRLGRPRWPAHGRGRWNCVGTGGGPEKYRWWGLGRRFF